MYIPKFEGAIPYINTRQMIEVDRAMVEDYHIDRIQMMENAGRCLAILCRERFLQGDPQHKWITVLAGSGGNGGGALVAARRLHNWGAQVHVILAQTTERMTEFPGHQLEILHRMDVDCDVGPGIPASASTPQLIIDGLVGYSLNGAPYGVTRKLIDWVNANEAPVVALDTPSGIDTTTGTVFEPSVKATATMTLALPKEGLRAEGAAEYVGELYLADISVPPALYKKMSPGIDVGPIFAAADLVRV